MGELLEGDDGLPVEDVGVWSKDKLTSLRRYVDISRAVRRKWTAPEGAGATYIDLYCGPGRSRIRRTGEFIDGSCVAAWKESLRSNSPFSTIYIGDADAVRRRSAAERLRRLGAPVIEVEGNAASSATAIRKLARGTALHFAFLDPYNLGSFDFSIMQTLSNFRYIDILVHISKMDLQRNTWLNISRQQSAFDSFAPGWRSHVDINQPHSAIRRDVFNHWQKLVCELGVFLSSEIKLIKGSREQHLYWLAFVARSALAHKFWKVAADNSGQGRLF